jgi:hypothetical protein
MPLLREELPGSASGKLVPGLCFRPDGRSRANECGWAAIGATLGGEQGHPRKENNL